MIEPKSAKRKSTSKAKIRAGKTDKSHASRGKSKPTYPLLSDICHAVFENAEDAIFVKDLSLKYIQVNSMFARRFKTSADKLAGKTGADLFEPEISEQIAANERRVLKGEAIEMELPLPKIGANYYHVIEVPLRDQEGDIIGLCGIARDITERKRAEQALQESEARLRLITDNMSDLISQTDPLGNYLYVSPSHKTVLGYDPAELLGKNALDFMPPEDAERVKATLYQAAETGTNFQVEYRFRHKNGRYLWLESKGLILFNANGEPERSIQSGRDITDRKNAEEALRQSEAKLQMITDNMIDLVAQTGVNGLVEYVSPSYKTVLGYSPEELIGRRIDGLLYPEDSETVRNAVIQSLKSRQTVTVQFRFRHKNGHYLWMEANGKFIYNDQGQAVKGIFSSRDISQRRAAENGLRESEEKYRSLVQESAAGYGLVDKEGKFILLNPALAKISGYSEQEALGHYFWDFIHPDQRELIKKFFQQRVQEGGASPVKELKILTKDGQTKYVIGRPILVYKAGKVVGQQIVVIDITEKRKLEEELQKQETLESLGVLAGGIAHDFNNILMAIVGHISFAALKIGTEHEAFESLAEAEKAAFRAKDLTEQLLTFSQGGAPIKKATSLPELLKDSAGFALRGSNVAVKYSIAENLWAAEADPGQLSRVIHNIVLNADQSMPKGGTIEIKAENMTLAENGQKNLPLAQGKYVKISITDSGMGIPEEYLPKIFDPFFTTKQKGSGLGLSIAYSVIKKHGGHIEVESKVGHGTAFHLYIPASDKPAPEKRAEKQPPVQGKGKILLMEDDAAVRNAAVHILEHIGYQVVSSRDGVEAVALYQEALTKGEPFDAVILDLTVPGGMGGEEAVKKLLAIDPAAKVIVSSGYSTDPVMAEYKKYGFKGVIAKPYKIQQLRELLFKTIGR